MSSNAVSYRVNLSDDIKFRSYRCIHLLSLETDAYESVKQATFKGLKLILDSDRLDLYLLFHDFPRDWYKGKKAIHFMLSPEEVAVMSAARAHLSAILSREVRKIEIVAAALYLLSTIPDDRIGPYLEADADPLANT